MKRIAPLFFVMLCLTGCIKDDLRQMHKEIEELREVTLASLSQQAGNISTSLTDLDALSKELEGFIRTLEGSTKQVRDDLKAAQSSLDNFRGSFSDSISGRESEFLATIETMDRTMSGHIANADSVLATLKAADSSIDARITDLRGYVDSLYTTKDWAAGTLATLTKEQQILSDIETIKAQIVTLEEASEDFNKLLEKFIEETLSAYKDKFEGQVASQMTSLTDDYTKAIASMKALLTEESSKAIKEKIAASEQKTMDWVSDKLSAYLTVSEATSRIEAFKALMGALPEGKSFQGEIDSLNAALEDAVKNITDTYRSAVEDAINNHEGQMSETMAQKISSLHQSEVKDLEDRTATLQGDISKLYESIIKLEGRIKSVEEQAEEIEDALEDLHKLQDDLHDYISEVQKALQKADQDNYQKLRGLVTALQSLDDSLSNQIKQLESYVGTIAQGCTSLTQWVETSVATLKEQFANYYTIERIDFIVDSLDKALVPIDSALADHGGKLDAFADSISRHTSLLEDELKGWVSKTLTDNYTDADSTKFHLDSLELLITGMFKDGDDAVLKKLQEVRDDLDKAIEDLTEKYEKAIKDAIEKEDGYITATIRESLENATGEIKNLAALIPDFESEVAELQKRMSTLETDITNLIDSLGAISNHLDTLIEGYEHTSLKSIADAILARLNACKEHLGSSSDTLNSIKDSIYNAGNIKSQIEALAHLHDDMALSERQIDTLQSFFGGYLGTTTLDSLIKSIRDSIGKCAAAKDLTELNTRIASLKDLQDRVVKLEAAYKSAQDNLDKLNTFFGDISKTTFEQIVKAVEDSIATLASIEDLDKLTTSVGGLESTFGTIASRLDEYTSAVDSLKAQYAGLTSKMADISSLIFKLKEDIAAYITKEGADLDEIAKLITSRTEAIDTLRAKLDGAFARLRSLEKSTDSLGLVTTAVEELFKKFEDKIAEYIPKGRQDSLDLITRFTEIGNLTDDVNSTVADIDSVQKAIAKLEGSIVTLRDSTSTMDGVVEGIKNSLADYVRLSSFTDTFNVVKKLMPYIYSTDSLATELRKVEATIATLDKFFKSYYEGTDITTLKSLLASIHSTLDSLEKQEIHGSDVSTPLQDRITAIKTVVDEVASKLDPLAAEVAAWSLCNKFTTVTYVPKYFDQAERSSFGSYSFDFLIFPEEVASLLTSTDDNPYIAMVYHGSSDHGELQITAIRQDGSNKNKITVVTEASVGDVSAALHVEIKDADGNVKATFTSDYIALIKR